MKWDFISCRVLIIYPALFLYCPCYRFHIFEFFQKFQMNAPLSFDTDEEWDITLSINSILSHTAQHNSQSSPSSSIPHDNQVPELDMVIPIPSS
jgi:hypothetical protein